MARFSSAENRSTDSVEWSALDEDSEVKAQTKADVVEAKLRVNFGLSCSCATCSMRESFDWFAHRSGEYHCPLLKIAVSTLPKMVTCDYWNITC